MTLEIFASIMELMAFVGIAAYAFGFSISVKNREIDVGGKLAEPSAWPFVAGALMFVLAGILEISYLSGYTDAIIRILYSFIKMGGALAMMGGFYLLYRMFKV